MSPLNKELSFGLFNGLNLVYGQEWLSLPPETLKTGKLCLLGAESRKENQ